MGRHYVGCGREIQKRGMNVEVKPASSPEGAQKALESAIRTLKRRMVQEGVIRDLRNKEYAETKGQIRRKKRQDAIRREKKRNRTQV